MSSRYCKGGGGKRDRVVKIARLTAIIVWIRNGPTAYNTIRMKDVSVPTGHSPFIVMG